MTAVTCRCGRVCASRSGRAAHGHRCPVEQRWQAVAFDASVPFTPTSTREQWDAADREVKLVLADAGDLLAEVVLMGVRREITTRGVRGFADLQQQLDANELLRLRENDADEFDHLNAVTARFDQLLAEQSLTARVRADAGGWPS